MSSNKRKADTAEEELTRGGGKAPRVAIDITDDTDDADDGEDDNRVIDLTALTDSESERDAPPGSECESDDDDDERHHPGYLEVDYDSWMDHDENCHGTIDSNRMRRDYPENFIWSCCGERGDEIGCTRGPGKTVDEKYATSPEPSLDGDSDAYHDGVLEVDWEGDFWADHDENCHGTIDTKTNRREYPEGFKWSCCDAVGTYSKGCCST